MGSTPVVPDWANNDPHFDGETIVPERDDSRLARQLTAVRAFMSDHGWHTLAEIALNVDAPEASVSARLRDLRKPRFGGLDIQRRYVGTGLFEYAWAPDASAPKEVGPAPEPVKVAVFVCQTCGKTAFENDMWSKWGKPQLVGEIKGKRLLEARCHTCEPKPKKGLQSVWREQ
jgi:hypothetical protein